MATFHVSFCKDRHGNRERAHVTLPDCVPLAARSRAICATLQVQGWTEAHDIIYITKPVTISAVEAGIPDTEEYAHIDILAAG